MSQPMSAPPPPPPKKRMSPLAWVGIGCGIVIVLGLAVFVAAGWFVKRQVDKFAENPAMAAAELAVRASPDLEVVESDAEAGTLTVRNTKTGEVVTVNAEEAAEGKISFTTKEGTTTVEGVTGESGGTFKVTGDKGEEATFSMGAGAPKGLPAWLPTYPGGQVQGSFDSTNEGTGERSAAFSVTTSDPVTQVLEFYERGFRAAGLTADKTSFETNGAVAGGTVSGTSGDQKRTASVMVSTSEGKTSALVTFSDKP